MARFPQTSVTIDSLRTPPLGPYSTAVAAQGLIFLSGVIPYDASAKTFALPDFPSQMRVPLANLDAALEAAGARRADVIKTTIFLRDPADMPRMNAAYAAYFGPTVPARTTVPGVDWGRPDIKVEIEAIVAAPRHLQGFPNDDTTNFADRTWGGIAAAMLPGCATTLARKSTVDDRPVPTETLGLRLTDAQRSDGVAFLRDHASVDVHAHPGLFFLCGARAPTPAMTAFGKPFEDRAIADIASGRVSAALFAGVSDMRLLELSRTGITAAREFAPGEAYADYRRQLANLRALVAGGTVMAGTSPIDILRAHRRGRTACIFSIEGGDFIEDRLERVAEAYAAGVRSITIVHYHVNQIGDIQTAAPRHNGLTALGKTHRARNERQTDDHRSRPRTI